MIQRASSEATKDTTSAMSAGWPTRSKAENELQRASCSGSFRSHTASIPVPPRSADDAVRRGVHRALRSAAVEYTRPERPPGCLVLSAAVTCVTDSVDIQALLRDRRAANLAALRERIAADMTAMTAWPPERSAPARVR